MSSILNALNKSEAERQRAQPPGWNSPMQFGRQTPPPRRRRWLAVLAILAIIVLAALFWWRSGPAPEAGSQEPERNVAEAAGTGPETASQPATGGNDDATTDGPLPRQPSRTADADAADIAFSQAQRAERIARIRAAAPSIEELQAMSRERRAAQEQIRRDAQAAAQAAREGSSRPGEGDVAALEEALIESLVADEEVDDATLDELVRAATDLAGAGQAGPVAADEEEPATTAPVSSQARPAAPTAPAPASRVVASSTPSADQVAAAGAESLPLLNELPYATRSALPAMDLTMHLYSQDAARRMILINGARAGDGDELDNGLRILSIRPDGVAMEYQGTRFLLPSRP